MSENIAVVLLVQFKSKPWTVQHHFFHQTPPCHLTSDSENNSLHSNYLHDHYHSAADNEDSWDLDIGNELPDMDCDDILEAEQEPDLDKEIVVAPEITAEKELDAFSQLLFNAQAAAQKAEQAHEGQQKQSRHYHGNDGRTKCCHKKMGKDLAWKG
ncbi:hypothetical protein B0H14DRAFT_2647194 [Mycena olivaceomarginata]|nr:hypothetical protein B0H14DRAFT_2647194 [Mycena olivaceomarginata]